MDTAKETARVARKLYRERIGNHQGHASFLASEVLEEAAEATGFEHYGVEGFCDSVGQHGVSYLNRGDPYEQTVIFRTRSERFSVGCWGNHPHA